MPVLVVKHRFLDWINEAQRAGDVYFLLARFGLVHAANKPSFGKKKPPRIVLAYGIEGLLQCSSRILSIPGSQARKKRRYAYMLLHANGGRKLLPPTLNLDLN